MIALSIMSGKENRDRVRISLQRACYIFVYQLMVTVWVIKDVVSQTDLQINHFKKITIFLIHMMKYTVQ